MIDILISFHIYFIVSGIMLFTIGMHYKKEGKDIKFKMNWGFTSNLNTRGKIITTIGTVLIIIGLSLYR